MSDDEMKQEAMPWVVVPHEEKKKESNVYAQGCGTILYLLMILILVGTIIGLWIKYFWIGVVFA